MLCRLSIRNVVAVESLDLQLGSGLTVFTGETGAGKSVLLDALGLVLGDKARPSLVRAGAEKATIRAAFEYDRDARALAIAVRHDACEDDVDRSAVDDDADPSDAKTRLILRRMVASNRSAAYLNEQPVALSVLRHVGIASAEIDGQFASRGLLDPSRHRDIIDDYGIDRKLLDRVRESWDKWRRDLRERAKVQSENSIDGDDIIHWQDLCAKIADMAPHDEEEDDLIKQRRSLRARDAILSSVADITDCLDSDSGQGYSQKRVEASASGGAISLIAKAGRKIERMIDAHRRDFDNTDRRAPDDSNGDSNGDSNRDVMGDVMAAALESLNKADSIVRDADDRLRRMANRLRDQSGDLDSVEARLFALRELARHCRVAVGQLASWRQEKEQAITNHLERKERLRDLDTKIRQSRQSYLERSEKLSANRRGVADRFIRAINAELPKVRLENARMSVRMMRFDETQWGQDGIDHVYFELQANPGLPPAPLHKAASGGELSRILLVLRCISSTTRQTPTVVFDEIDSGIGGAAAAAVGARLRSLADTCQVLCITHSPQVAGMADHHFVVSKQVVSSHTRVQVRRLDGDARREEISRLLAGAKITDEARLAADQLIFNDETKGQHGQNDGHGNGQKPE